MTHRFAALLRGPRPQYAAAVARRNPPRARKPTSFMIAKLFSRLTTHGGAGDALFAWATAEARRRDWYAQGAVPDTIDGRFAVLSTVTALCCLRLEQLGDGGERLSVALTERFAEVMESEHRELGIGDPTLGKTVLKLVGSLARKVDELRGAMAGHAQWEVATQAVLPAAEGPAIAARAAQLERLARRLRAAELDDLAEGEIR